MTAVCREVERVHLFSGSFPASLAPASSSSFSCQGLMEILDVRVSLHTHASLLPRQLLFRHCKQQFGVLNIPLRTNGRNELPLTERPERKRTNKEKGWLHVCGSLKRGPQEAGPKGVSWSPAAHSRSTGPISTGSNAETVLHAHTDTDRGHRDTFMRVCHSPFSACHL